MPDKKWAFITEETKVLIKNCLVNSHNQFPCARGTIGCIVDHKVIHYGNIPGKEEAKSGKPFLGYSNYDNKTKATGEKD